MGDDKPFCCTSPGCGMRFTNEDHLTVHLKKHEMSLSLNTDDGANNNIKAASSSVMFVDQTPTPTRFIRNCEEVGLFQDLQSVNPFEEHFRKAVEATKGGNPPTIESLRLTSDNDILHTPSVLPADLEAVSRLVNSDQCHHITLDTPSVPNVEPSSDDTVVGLCETVQDDSRDEVVVEEAPSTVIEQENDEVCVIESSSNDLTVSANDNVVCFSGASEDLSILPTTESLGVQCSCECVSTSAQSKSVPSVTSSSSSSSSVRVVPQIKKKTCYAPTPPPVSVENSTTLVQLILKLPDGRSLPVSIPAMPAVASSGATPLVTATTTITAASLPIASSVTSPQSLNQHPTNSKLANNTASFAKMKLRQALTAHDVGINNDQIKLTNQQMSSSLDFLNFDSASNDSDSHDLNQPSSKRRRGRDDGPEEKRRKFLERNRAAATRCRQKRKQWVQSLESKADELNVINQQLQEEVSMLRNEVAQLKSMLLAHKNCPVTQQQQRNLEQVNGLAAGSALIIHKSGSTEVIQMTPAEVIASSALTNLAQTMDGGGSLPVVVRTMFTTDQAMELLTSVTATGHSSSVPQSAVTDTEEEVQVIAIDEAGGNETSADE